MFFCGEVGAQPTYIYIFISIPCVYHQTMYKESWDQIVPEKNTVEGVTRAHL